MTDRKYLLVEYSRKDCRKLKKIKEWGGLYCDLC